MPDSGALRRPTSGPTSRSASAPTIIATIVPAFGAAALGAWLGTAHPTGADPADLLMRAAAGALIAVAATRASLLPLVITAAVAAALAPAPLDAVPGAVAVMLAVGAQRIDPDRRRSTTVLAVGTAGGMAALGLLRLSDFSVSRLSTLAGLLACAPLVVSAVRALHRSTRTRLLWAGALLGGVVLVIGVGYGVAGLVARGKLDQASALSSEALALARGGNSDAAAAKLAEAQPLFAAARVDLDQPWARPARFVPLLAQNVEAVARMAEVGEDVAGNGARVIPQADYRRLRIERGQVDLVALNALVAPVDELNATLARGLATMDRTDTTWLLPPIGAPFADLRSRLANTGADGTTVAEALRVAPAMLGGSGERRYFVAFTNPAESRALGGFVAAYGILRCDRGRITLDRTGGIDELTFAPGSRAFTDPRLDEFAREQAAWTPATYFQNLTSTPDPTTSALAIAELVRQVPGGVRIDGVLTVDPYGLAALMELTGPVPVEGLDTPVAPADAARFLLVDQYRLFENRADRGRRKDVLDDVARATFERLTSSALPGPGVIGRSLSPAVDAGRIRFVPFDEPEAALFERLGLRQRFGAIAGRDVLSLRTANSAGNKLDPYLRRELRYEVTVDPVRGPVRATATVRLTNDAPSDLPEYVDDNSYNGGDRGSTTQYVVLYSPWGVGTVTLDGSEVPVGRGTELGLRSSTVRIDIARGQSRTLTYDLGDPPSDLGKQFDTAGTPQIAGLPGAYVLELVPQPTVNPDAVTVVLRDPSGEVLLSRERQTMAPETFTVSAER